MDASATMPTHRASDKQQVSNQAGTQASKHDAAQQQQRRRRRRRRQQRMYVSARECCGRHLQACGGSGAGGAGAGGAGAGGAVPLQCSNDNSILRIGRARRAGEVCDATCLRWKPPSGASANERGARGLGSALRGREGLRRTRSSNTAATHAPNCDCCVAPRRRISAAIFFWLRTWGRRAEHCTRRPAVLCCRQEAVQTRSGLFLYFSSHSSRTNTNAGTGRALVMICASSVPDRKTDLVLQDPS